MFAKIFEQIFDSSIAEDWKTRLVFEDMLVLADQNGVVDRTHEAISRRTNVPLDVVIDAINKLEQPDKRSRNQISDGRRIVKLDEHRDWGWLIVNYESYRKIASEEQRRIKTLERVKKYREKDNDVTHCNASLRISNAFPYASASISSCIDEGGAGGDEFNNFWKAYPRKIGKQAAFRAWHKAKNKPNLDIILKAIAEQSKSQQWKKECGQFIPHPATWINQGRWDDEVIVYSEKKPRMVDLKNQKNAIEELKKAIIAKHSFCYREEREKFPEKYAELKKYNAKIIEINQQMAGLSE